MAVPGAQAETECVRLFDRLDQIELQAGASGEGQLEDARAMYEQLGCANLSNDPTCRNLSSQISSMQAGGAGNRFGRERRQIMADLRRLGCLSGQSRGSWNTEGAKNPEVFEDLYREGGGQDVWRSAPQDSGQNNDGQIIRFGGDGTRFRTLCVRTCDGFYWPISFSAQIGDFARDQEMCAASCPGQEVALYVHHNPGEWSDQAQSPEGEPYSALANAFVYRKRFIEQCSCQAQVKILSGPEADTPAGLPETPPEETPRPAPPPEPQTDVYRSVPIIMPPGPSGQKATTPSGLRGASP